MRILSIASAVALASAIAGKGDKQSHLSSGKSAPNYVEGDFDDDEDGAGIVDKETYGMGEVSPAGDFNIGDVLVESIQWYSEAPEEMYQSKNLPSPHRNVAQDKLATVESERYGGKLPLNLRKYSAEDAVDYYSKNRHGRRRLRESDFLNRLEVEVFFAKNVRLIEKKDGEGSSGEGSPSEGGVGNGEGPSPADNDNDLNGGENVEDNTDLIDAGVEGNDSDAFVQLHAKDRA